MGERMEGEKGEMKLRLRQKGDLFCLGDSGAAIGDWGYLPKVLDTLGTSWYALATNERRKDERGSNYYLL